MVETRFRRRVSRNQKKSIVPLSKLRTSEVVRTVVDHPRRLEELIRMLDDRDRSIRGRAAATLARLSQTHPARLIRVLDRLCERLSDESAYVRWNLVYTLGQIADRQPHAVPKFFPELRRCLDDENAIVSVMAVRAFRRLARRKQKMVKELFAGSDAPIPAALLDVIGTHRSPEASKE